MRCCQINLQIPGFLEMSSKPPSDVLKCVGGPLMLQSSTKGQVTWGISASRIKATSSWNIATALVQP